MTGAVRWRRNRATKREAGSLALPVFFAGIFRSGVKAGYISRPITARGARNQEEFMSASPAGQTADAVSIVRIEAAINAWREVYPPAPDGEDGYALDAGSDCLAEVYGAMICHQQTSVPLDALNAEQRDALFATEV